MNHSFARIWEPYLLYLDRRITKRQLVANFVCKLYRPTTKNKVAADAREKDLILILDFFFSVSSGWIALSLVGGHRDAISKGPCFHTTLFPVLPHNIYVVAVAPSSCFQALVLLFEPFPLKVIVRLKDVLSPTVKQ